ncbi:MAG: selenide, water dikinase SelD [Bacteroidota bacterium]
MTEPIKLSQYAKGAGCGCKIAPAILEQILASSRVAGNQQNLLVGNNHNDDASVYDLQNGQALIVTTDFFMPIVDDAFTFGQAAAANAISDVYAMGGKPITAIAILGWPIDKIPADVAAKVLDGAKDICAQAGIVISGGHTIDAAEPFFGLSVNGLAPLEHIKRNDTAQAGDIIFLTKPIGVGILATAQKRGKLLPEHEQILTEQLIKLNSFGEILGKEKGITAMTDITGFGLLGHLIEMCEGSGVSAEINYASIPKLESAILYSQQFIIPDATYRNWNAYSEKVSIAPTVDATESFALLPDPQTNGGLLFTVSPSSIVTVKDLAQQANANLTEIGLITPSGDKCIYMQ